MKLLKLVLLGALLAARVQASSLTFTLDPSVEVDQPASYPVSVAFSGTLTDTDTADTCDSDNVDCLYLNFISFSFDQSTAISHLIGDATEFYETPGILSDDGPDMFNFFTGNIFGITVAPNTPVGVYTGSVTIYGGYDDPDADNSLATSTFTVVVAPEPAGFALGMLGVAAIALAKRRVSR